MWIWTDIEAGIDIGIGEEKKELEEYQKIVEEKQKTSRRQAEAN